MEKGQEEKRQTLGSKWLHHNSVFDHDTVYCIVQGKVQICPDTVHVRCLENVCPNPLSNYKYFKAGARKRSILLRTQRHYGVSSSCIQIQHAPLALPSNLQYSTGTQSSPLNCFVLHLTDLETVDVA